MTDDDTGTTNSSATVTVINVAPVVESGGDQTVNEGEPVEFGGSFSDPGSLDTHTIEWDSADGETESGTLTPTHVYADDGIYTVSLTVADDDSGITFDTLTVTVLNVAPTLVAGADQTVEEGASVNLDPATFNDQGTLDTHTATIDWGDGSPEEAGAVSESPFGPPGSTAGADGMIDGSHTYGDSGVYTVTVTVTDDDGATATDTFDATVNNIGPQLTLDPVAARMRRVRHSPSVSTRSAAIRRRPRRSTSLPAQSTN